MSFRVRLHSVKYKDGRPPLRVLYPRPDTRAALMRVVRQVFDQHPDPSAMALVVWNADCLSSTRMIVDDRSTIPTALVPDFVRNLLLAERIESWTLESLRDQGR